MYPCDIHIHKISNFECKGFCFNTIIHIVHLQQSKHKNRLLLITIIFYDTYIVSIVGGIWKRDTVIELYAANYPKNKCNS